MAETESRLIELWVPGRPRTKGSLQAQHRYDAAGRVVGRRRGSRVVPDVRLTDTEESKKWRRIVTEALEREAALAGWATVPLPLTVGGHLIAWVPFEEITHPHAGDGDKHLRQLWDAMTGARIWEDDRQGGRWTVEKRSAFASAFGPGYQTRFWIEERA